MEHFTESTYLPTTVMDAITTVRVESPGLVARLATERTRRQPLAPRGRLSLLAVDHPARGVTNIGDDPRAMADRGSLLARIHRCLQAPSMDGVMATMDILQDLLLLDDLVQKAGGSSVLDERALIASMNRGGLAGSTWELDDPLTGPTVEDLKLWNLNGGKLLLRLCLDDPGSLRTLEMCAQTLRALSRGNVPCFLEPLPVERKEGRWAVVMDTDALARMVGVASGLGESTHMLWLKLPWCQDFARVARATTLPILLLGGPAAGDISGFLEALEHGLAASANVRGTMVGRNVLYPGDDDPLVAAVAVSGVVHEGWSASRARDEAGVARGRDLDAITRWLGEGK